MIGGLAVTSFAIYDVMRRPLYMFVDEQRDHDARRARAPRVPAAASLARAGVSAARVGGRTGSLVLSIVTDR